MLFRSGEFGGRIAQTVGDGVGDADSASDGAAAAQYRGHHRLDRPFEGVIGEILRENVFCHAEAVFSIENGVLCARLAACDLVVVEEAVHHGVETIEFFYACGESRVEERDGRGDVVVVDPNQRN